MDKKLWQQNCEIRRIDKELHSVLDNVSKRINVPMSVLWMLYMIVTAPEPMTQAELCMEWRQSRQTINSTVKKMIQDGLIYQEMQEGNRKNKLLYLTDKGQELADRYVPNMMIAEEEALKRLTPSEREELIRLMRKFTDVSNEEFEKYVQ